MKKYIITLLAAAIVLSGCDALRKIAGRPTEAQIEAMRSELLAQREEAIQKARLDSIAAVQQALEDSLEVLRLSGIAKSSEGYLAKDYPHKYAIVLGAFKEEGNAEKFSKKVQAEGYKTDIINFRSGYKAVCACPTEDLNEAFRTLDKLLAEDFCPMDAWILVNQ